jgi:alpha-tubulin suppressor-like RCC1 family protein
LQVAAGGSHTCAGVDGGVQCWGDNTYGQLGDGTHSGRTTPVDVVGLNASARALITGDHHTCALTASNGVKCWGGNGAGQLGDGTTTDRTTPVDVSGLGSGVHTIAAGGGHTCALVYGGVRCWGWNADGQLGDGSKVIRTTPVAVSGLSSGMRAVAAGASHTCAVTDGGAVQCWGDNRYGQLGDGSTTDRTTPVNVLGLDSGVRAIAAGGYHTCALTAAGQMKCWGANDSGQLGDGTTIQHATPVDVSGLAGGVSALGAGGCHTCALMDTVQGGGIQCWGDNGHGQLGDGTTIPRMTPVEVFGLTINVDAVAAGTRHTCAVVQEDRLTCWGRNDYGQLGDGSMQDRTIPVHVAGFGVDIRRYLPLILHQ